MDTIQIKGKVQRVALGPGFWGMVDEAGQKWRLENLDKSAQKEGLVLLLEVELLAQGPSFLMWGKPVKVLKIHAIDE